MITHTKYNNSRTNSLSFREPSNRSALNVWALHGILAMHCTVCWTGVDRAQNKSRGGEFIVSTQKDYRQMFYLIFVCAHYYQLSVGGGWKVGSGLSGSAIALSPPPHHPPRSIGVSRSLSRCPLYMLWPFPAAYYPTTREFLFRFICGRRHFINCLAPTKHCHLCVSFSVIFKICF